MSIFKRLCLTLFCCIFVVVFLLGATTSYSKTSSNSNPPLKSKFYDFSDQLIDGQIRRPTTLYTDARQRARFERLLRLKRSFLSELFNSAKEKVFK